VSAWPHTLSAPPRRHASPALLLLALAGLTALAGCVVGGYDGDPGAGYAVGYGVDYYEPYGYEYGGWGPGYGIGPPRRGYDRGGRGDGRPGPRPSYRPAPASRPMPSLPSHSGGRAR